MSNLYNEQENKWAAQISNCKITNDQILWARDMFNLKEDEAPTFEQIVLACEEENYQLWFRKPEDVELEFFEEAKNKDFGNWKIVGIYDDNDNSGFYAVAIETGEYTKNGVENGVFFSVRGTEPTTKEQKFLDLVYTDANIITIHI